MQGSGLQHEPLKPSVQSCGAGDGDGLSGTASPPRPRLCWAEILLVAKNSSASYTLSSSYPKILFTYRLISQNLRQKLVSNRAHELSACAAAHDIWPSWWLSCRDGVNPHVPPWVMASLVADAKSLIPASCYARERRKKQTPQKPPHRNSTFPSRIS